MNSEEIKARFGSYHVDVLEQDQTSRFANLYSIHDGVAVCRTLAITRFSQPISPALQDADKQIRAGHSIGNTLQQAGLLMSREVIIEARTPCGQQFSTLCAQTVLVDSPVYLRVYRLHAGTEPQKLPPTPLSPRHITPSTPRCMPDSGPSTTSTPHSGNPTPNGPSMRY